jgi:hypothetical protein
MLGQALHIRAEVRISRCPLYRSTALVQAHHSELLRSTAKSCTGHTHARRDAGCMRTADRYAISIGLKGVRVPDGPQRARRVDGRSLHRIRHVGEARPSGVRQHRRRRELRRVSSRAYMSARGSASSHVKQVPTLQALNSLYWRRGWDSNPRAAHATRRFRGAPVTTTSVPLRRGRPLSPPGKATEPLIIHARYGWPSRG